MNDKHTKKFFDKKQPEITKQKLELYNGYIEKFAITLLMAKGKIFIADLFCGPGYNGEEKGSPLLLIDTLDKLLTDKTLLKKHLSPTVFILFNDKFNIEQLKENLKGYPVNSNIKIKYENKDFNDILINIKNVLNNTKIPKFFFLDQFSYSTVSFDDIKKLFFMGNTEILLFTPIMDLHRFVNAKNILENKTHKTRKVIEDFTEKGVGNHYDKDTYKLGDEIISKMRKELNSDYIRYVILDDGSRKNALFYISSHLLGLIKFNNVSSKLGDFGIGKIDIKIKKEEKKENYQMSLFGEKVLDNKCNKKLSDFEESIINMLKSDKISNVEIIKFTAINGVLINDVKEILNKLKNKGKLNIEYVNGGTTRSLYIADTNWNQIKCYIKYNP